MNDEFEKEVLRGIARLETKMDAATGRLEDHGRRLRVLEQFRNYAAGALGVIAAAWASVKININK